MEEPLSAALRWHVGDVVMKVRLHYRWTAGKLAERAGVSPNTVTDLELGRSRRPDTLGKVATALGMSLVELESLVPRRHASSAEQSSTLQFSSDTKTPTGEVANPEHRVAFGAHGSDRTVHRDFEHAIDAFKEATTALDEATEILRDIAAGSLLSPPRKKAEKASATRPKSSKQAGTHR